MTIEPVSVIVPAYNCETTISQTLTAILNQDYRGTIEVIVVDDGSTDATARLVKAFSQIKYFHQENSGPASARNRGAKESRFDFIFFTDSDCIPQRDWLLKLMSRFDDPKVAVVSGSYAIANPEIVLARCIHQEILYRHKNLMSNFPKSFGSYNFGVRRKIFESLRGFNPEYRHASGEDNDLSYKILNAGFKIYFEKNALVKHYHARHLKKYLIEQYSHGFWRVKMYLDHPYMVKGDDYTFWKDIVEVPLVIVCFFGLFEHLFMSSHSFFVVSSLLIFLGIEFVFGFVQIERFVEKIIWALVMFLRAWFRTAGFLVGFLYFLPLKILKKIK